MVIVREVTDSELRQTLAAAEAALDEGSFSECVRCSVAAYTRLIEQRPDMIVAPRMAHGGPGGVAMGGPRPWPSDHGVSFSMHNGSAPTLTFSKERFTLSEAATYFEYTLDMVLRAQRRPPAAT